MAFVREEEVKFCERVWWVEFREIEDFPPPGKFDALDLNIFKLESISLALFKILYGYIYSKINSLNCVHMNEMAPLLIRQN